MRVSDKPIRLLPRSLPPKFGQSGRIAIFRKSLEAKSFMKLEGHPSSPAHKE
jgi:hypothetical protein